MIDFATALPDKLCEIIANEETDSLCGKGRDFGDAGSRIDVAMIYAGFVLGKYEKSGK